MRQAARELRTSTPAAGFVDGHPIGNGALGAMVLAEPGRVSLGLNHEWLWRARHRHRELTDRAAALPEIRAAFLAGDLDRGSELAAEHLGGRRGGMEFFFRGGEKGHVDAYQPAADLSLDIEGEPRDFQRSLDLGTAIATASWTSPSGRCVVDSYACHQLPLVVTELTGSGPLPTVRVALHRTPDPDCELELSTGTESLLLRGTFAEGTRFSVVVRALGDGLRSIDGTTLTVTGGRRLVLLTSIAVSHDGQDDLAAARAALDGVQETGLREDHVAGHQAMFGRVVLDLGSTTEETSVEQQVEALAQHADPAAVAAAFDFGRYLLMSSSRPGGLPANLQGIWNDSLKPAWDCDLHQDINLQMAYWPAEPCGLVECTEPLFDHIERFLPGGREAARKLYGTRGVVFPLQTDPWGRATPESDGWDVWVGAAAWLAQHLWWRWEWGGDRTFLEHRVWPVLQEVAAFYQDYLVPHDGRLHLVPSQSPENTFVGGAVPVSLCVSATGDVQLADEALRRAAETCRLVGGDPALAEHWDDLRTQLPPMQVGRHGQLQEWFHDYEEAEPGHRHLSHLFALYPGDTITPEGTPELAQACRATLERRLAHGSGPGGWSRAWIAVCFARLGDGDAAHAHITRLVLDQLWESTLLVRERLPPEVSHVLPSELFQLDGNCGLTAAVVECLLQSHGGVLRILPALPSALPRGSVSGLRARGGHRVDISWQDGEAVSVTVEAERDSLCRIREPWPGRTGVSAGTVTERTGQDVVVSLAAGAVVRLHKV